MQLQVQMLAARNRNDEAVKLLRDAIAKNPKQPQLWSSLADVFSQQGDLDQVGKLLQESVKVLGDSVPQRVMQATYLAQRHEKDAKDRLRKLAENTDKFSEGECVQLWRGLLDPSMQVGDLPQVQLFCQKIAEKRPDDMQIRHVQFQLAMAINDRPAMERTLDDIERLAGQSAFWLWGRAVLLEMQSNDQKDPEPMLKQALGYLFRARELRGDWPLVLLAMARIHDRQNRSNLAMKDLLNALDAGDRTPNTIRRHANSLPNAAIQ